MNTRILMAGVLFALTLQAQGQGRVSFHTGSAPTRLWSLDGPLAGPGIWGQLLAGSTPQALAPVGLPQEHRLSGIVAGPVIEVPTVPCETVGYAQMVAWDGRLWGTVYADVPANQLGATDVRGTIMSCFPYPAAAPGFTQPAIVPIPEPPAWAFGFLAGAVALVKRFVRCYHRHSKARQPSPSAPTTIPCHGSVTTLR